MNKRYTIKDLDEQVDQWNMELDTADALTRYEVGQRSNHCYVEEYDVNTAGMRQGSGTRAVSGGTPQTAYRDALAYHTPRMERKLEQCEKEDTEPKVYRIKSDGLAYAPGIIRFCIAEYRGTANGQLHAIRTMACYKDLPIYVVMGILEQSIHYIVEGDTVVVTIENPALCGA